MKTRLLISFLILAGFANIAFAQEWYPGMGLQVNDFFEYEACGMWDGTTCSPFELILNVTGSSDESWDVLMNISSDEYALKIPMKISKNNAAVIEHDEPHRARFVNFYSNTLAHLNVYTTFEKPSRLDKNPFGGQVWIGTTPAITNPAERLSLSNDTINTIPITWYNDGFKSTIWVSENIPFPVKGEIFSSWNKTSATYQFELTNYIPNQNLCDVNNAKEVRSVLSDDPVVLRFLEYFPSAAFNHFKNIDEPGNPRTHVEFSYGEFLLRVLVLTYDQYGDCYPAYGYSIGYETQLSDTKNLFENLRVKSDGVDKAIADIKNLSKPQRQLKFGISLDEIQCKENLVLIQKHDGTPACVMEQTKLKLVERGWTGEKVRDSGNPLQQKWTYNTNGEISSIDISEDDSTIVTGTTIRDTQKGMLYVLDNDGILLWKKEFDSMTGHVDISNDTILAKGFHLCGGGGGAITYCNYTADVFDINGKKKQSYTHEDKTTFSASLSPEGSSVITSTYDTLKYYNLNENKSWAHVPDKYIDWATFLTDSEIIVKLDNTGEIFALDNTGNKIWNFTTIHQNSYSYATSNDGKYFVISDDTSPDDGNIYLLNSGGNLLWQDNIGDTVLHLAFSGDASRILVEISGAFMTYDIDGNLLWKNNISSDLTMSSDGSFLLGTTFNQGSGASITLFDGKGNILSNNPISKESLGSVSALANNDDYLVMANDTNQLVMFEVNPDFEIDYDLTDLRNSDDLHVEIVPKTQGLFDVTIAKGDSVEIPWDIKFDQGYTRSNFDVSIESDSDMESWITPTSPYTTINGVPPSEKIITIHPKPDAVTGNHTVKILGRGDTVHNQTGWMTNLDGKTLGTINVSVIPKHDSLSIKTGNVHSERGTFCIDWKSGGGTACTGLVTYQKMPITVFSNVSQTVTLDATTVQKGGWIKFVPEKLVATPNGTSSNMLIAGYLVPFRSNPSAEKSLIIETSSETDSTTTVIPIRFGTISVINDEPSPISLGKIGANSNGTHYSISNAVYDPLKDDSADSVSVTLSVLGLWKDGNVSDLPDWLSVNIPKQSFALNATKPYHFMIVAQTDNAPVSGTYHIAINENINGENFTELQELVIENRRY